MEQSEVIEKNEIIEIKCMGIKNHEKVYLQTQSTLDFNYCSSFNYYFNG